MKLTDFHAPQISAGLYYKKNQKTIFAHKNLNCDQRLIKKVHCTFTDDSRSRADVGECNLLFVYYKVNYFKVKHIGKSPQRSSFEKQLIIIY